MGAINNFCYKISNCLVEKKTGKRNSKRVRVKAIIKNNKYNKNVVEKLDKIK